MAMDIKNKVDLAINILFEKDSFLLENGISERSVAHKLAEYLQVLFPEWNVDCEYNKKGVDPKELVGIKDCDYERTTDRIYPDIIIHKRNKKENLLVIEIKITSGQSACDIKKLELLTKKGKNKKYEYDFGAYIEFNKKKKHEILWYKDGKIDEAWKK